MIDQALIDLARAEGALPESIVVGMVFERVPARVRDGRRWKITARDHTRIEILAVPGGRRTKYAYVKLDAQGMGNGRPDRGVHRCDLLSLARHYSLVPTGAKRFAARP